MKTLTRPEGTRPDDLALTRRRLALAALGGYALYAYSAEAQAITTSAQGLLAGEVEVDVGDRMAPAYMARPDAPGRFPAVLVISEVFGIHEYIRDICRRLARVGYVAIAPDLFVRSGDPSRTNDFNQIRRIVGAATDKQIFNDLSGTVRFLKAQSFVDSRRMAVTGFCWGGAIAWLVCQRLPDFRAGAAWYGRLTAPKPGEFLGEPNRPWPLPNVAQLRAPVIGLYAGKDAGIPLSDVEAMRSALLAARKMGSQIIVYPDSQHRFHADYRTSYNAAAAKDAWARMLAHFATNGVKPRPF